MEWSSRAPAYDLTSAAPQKFRLKGPGREPFNGTMSSISSDLLGVQLQITVAKQQLRAVEQQGKDALSLIQSAGPAQSANTPPLNQAPSVGTALNIVG